MVSQEVLAWQERNGLSFVQLLFRGGCTGWDMATELEVRKQTVKNVSPTMTWHYVRICVKIV